MILKDGHVRSDGRYRLTGPSYEKRLRYRCCYVRFNGAAVVTDGICLEGRESLFFFVCFFTINPLKVQFITTCILQIRYIFSVSQYLLGQKPLRWGEEEEDEEEEVQCDMSDCELDHQPLKP